MNEILKKLVNRRVNLVCNGIKLQTGFLFFSHGNFFYSVGKIQFERHQIRSARVGREVFLELA